MDGRGLLSADRPARLFPFWKQPQARRDRPARWPFADRQTFRPVACWPEIVRGPLLIEDTDGRGRPSGEIVRRLIVAGDREARTGTGRATGGTGARGTRRTGKDTPDTEKRRVGPFSCVSCDLPKSGVLCYKMRHTSPVKCSMRSKRTLANWSKLACIGLIENLPFIFC